MDHSISGVPKTPANSNYDFGNMTLSGIYIVEKFKKAGEELYCSKCGGVNDDNAFKCIHCGTIIQQVSGAPQSQPVAFSPTAGQNVPTYLVPSILVTLLCCLPGGIAALIYASQVSTKLQLGDYNGAVVASNKAKMWVWISAGVGLVCLVIYGISMMANN